MERKRIAQEIVVGLVVIVALALLTAGILVLGQETRLFSRKVDYRTNFTDASGLRVGSPVTMAGVRIGSVSRIYLPQSADTTQGIQVFMSVDDDFAPRIRQDTTAKPVVLQLVSNEKAVELTPGDPDKPQKRPGDFITPDEPISWVERGVGFANEVETMASDLREILSAIRRGEGILGRAILDPEFGESSMESIESTLAAADALLRRLNRGEGLAGRVVADEEFAEAMTRDLEKTASEVAAFSARLNDERGVLAQLLEPGEADELVTDVGSLAASLKNVARSLESGKGLAPRLLRDEAYADRVSERLDEGLGHLSSILAKIDSGQGTLGRLVNDSALHDEAECILQGVQESKTAMWIVRYLRRQAADAGSCRVDEPTEAGS